MLDRVTHDGRLEVRSPAVGVRRVAQLRRTAVALVALYAVLAAIGTAVGGLMVLAGFLAFFAYAGLPLLAHGRRVSEPSTQTSAGIFFDGTLTVDGDEVTVSAHDGVLSAPRAAFSDGWIEPSPAGVPRVVLRHESGDLGVIEVPSVAAGHELLARVGFSADRHALRVVTSGNARQTLREMAFVASVFFLAAPLFALGVADDPENVASALVFLTLAGATAAALGASTIKPVVRVGLDGIEIARGRRRSFLPLRVVRDVSMTLAGVELLVDGSARPIVLRCWGVQQAALFGRIQEVVRGFGGASASAAQLAQLDRRGRHLARWREDLRRLAAEDGGDYRRIGLAREDLARLLQQGDAPTERRIGAALALAASGDPGERERVRIAASASASEELRAVLAAIAEDEVEAAESAVGSLLGTLPPPRA